MPHPIAKKRSVGVRRVSAIGDAALGKEGEHVRPPDAQQRADDPHGRTRADRPLGHDAPQGGDAPAAQKPHDHRLDLVVGRVAGGHGIGADHLGRSGEELVPGAASRHLQRAAGLPPQRPDIRPTDAERQPEAPGLGGHELRVAPRRIPAQAMVQVCHHHREAQFFAEVQQGVEKGHGVGAAGDGHEHLLAGPQHAGGTGGLGDIHAFENRCRHPEGNYSPAARGLSRLWIAAGTTPQSSLEPHAVKAKAPRCGGPLRPASRPSCRRGVPPRVRAQAGVAGCSVARGASNIVGGASRPASARKWLCFAELVWPKSHASLRPENGFVSQNHPSSPPTSRLTSTARGGSRPRPWRAAWRRCISWSTR